MNQWRDVLAEEKQLDYFKTCLSRVIERREQGVIVYPPKPNVFEAFKMTAFNDVKAVILGQDPYHGAKQAHGLCFSVQRGCPAPPSLQNIFKEMKDDLGLPIPKFGDLTAWARQGVFLLNTVLTVEAGKPQSHKNIGWERFTDRVIELISQHREHVVFLLWGSSAQQKARLIDQNKHTVLKAPHPSPLSAYRGFFGCKHFSETNNALIAHNQKPVDWQLED